MLKSLLAGVLGRRTAEGASAPADALRLFDEGDFDAAQATADERLAANPDDTAARLARGLLALEQDKASSALPDLERATQLAPAEPRGWVALARARSLTGGRKAALAALDQAKTLDPDHPDVLVELALQAFDAKRFDAAADILQRAGAARGSRAAEALCRLADVRLVNGKLEEGRDLLARAVLASESHTNAHANLGAVLKDLGREREAEHHLQCALALDARHAAAAFNLGLLRVGQRRWIEAVELLEQALAADTRDAQIAYWLGNAAMGAGNVQRARSAYQEALKRDRHHPQARWGIAMAEVSAVAADVQEQQHALQSFAREVEALEAWFRKEGTTAGPRAVGAQQPFYIAYIEENHRAVLARYGKLCADLMAPWARKSLPRPAAKPPGGKRRVGIVSAHVHSHSVWNAIVRGWVQHLDPDRFELHLFHTGSVRDAETQWAQKHAHRLHQDRGDWTAWAQAIAAEQLDVLVYPEIGMDATAVRLSALRLAPRQLASWGHPCTSGLPTIDGYVSADAFEPPDADTHYSEKLLRLPRLGCTYHSLPVAPEKVDPATWGVEKGDRLLLAPGTPFKYAPAHDGVLVEIARRCAPCKLLFFRGDADENGRRLEARLRAAFATAGVDFDRHVRFVPWLPSTQFFGLLQKADVFLDTIGFSGFNTAMQAVQCAAPIVAWEGRFLRGRFASAILRQMKLDEWVANDEAGYVDRVQRLCNDAELRKAVRAQIEQRRAPLFEDRGATDAFAEELLRSA